MAKVAMGLGVTVNENTGNIVAVYFKVRKGRIAKTLEFARGDAFADYDSRGTLLGVELLAPCNMTVLDRIARREPAPVRQFLRNSIPREMALA